MNFGSEMKNKFLIIAFLGLSRHLFAQTIAGNPPVSLLADYQLLHTTHETNFAGVSVTANKLITRNFVLGAGMEYSGAPQHDDNGYYLEHLRFVPVFADEKLFAGAKRAVSFYGHFSEGITFENYLKKNSITDGTAEHISKRGIYLYGGAGLQCRFFRLFSLYTEAGIKGYHISFNSLDVNPHGINGRVGISVPLSTR